MQDTHTDPDALAREDALRDLLRSFGSVCIGYSGGVDSVYLATIAVAALGSERVLAVTGRSAAYPAVQRDIALECSSAFGIPHLEIQTDEVDDPAYAANPANRCYHCKTELWTKLAAVARDRGLAVVLDGSNADDRHDYRPGMRAAEESGVRSPLLEVGLSKAQIRRLSRARGLPTWDAPSAPCLSSRLPYGVAVTRERLAAVEAAEDALRGLGFREFRVRHHGDVARLEFAATELHFAVHHAGIVASRIVEAGFPAALLDVEGYRRGALNETLDLVRIEPTQGRTIASAEQWAVATAGQHSDIAVVNAPPSEFERVRVHAPQYKRRGFRYVTVPLHVAPEARGRLAS